MSHLQRCYTVSVKHSHTLSFRFNIYTCSVILCVPSLYLCVVYRHTHTPHHTTHTLLSQSGVHLSLRSPHPVLPAQHPSLIPAFPVSLFLTPVFGTQNLTSNTLNVFTYQFSLLYITKRFAMSSASLII